MKKKKNPFENFPELSDQLPDLDRLFAGRVRKMPKKVFANPSAEYALVTAIIDELKVRHKEVVRKHSAVIDDDWRESRDQTVWLEQANNALDFIMKHVRIEICAVAYAKLRQENLPLDLINLSKHVRDNNYHSVI